MATAVSSDPLAYHELKIGDENRLFAIIYVVPSAVPIVTTKPGAYQKDDRTQTAFAEAAWLIRSGCRSKPAGHKEVRDLLRERQSPSAPLSPTTQAPSTSYELPIIHNLPRPNFLNFVGREKEIDAIMKVLAHERAWVASIEGIGGVGKTALAQKVALDIVSQAFRLGSAPWKFIIWMSAKENILALDDSIEEVEPSFRDLEDLLDVVLDVTDLQPNREAYHNLDQKLKAVKEILETFPCLLVLDNLETVYDEAVERFINDELPSPSKAIITSRQRTSMKGGSTIRLYGMDLEQAIQLLREAAHHQGSAVVAQAPQSKLEEIVDLTGGIPLALKLVVGQTALGTNLDDVIDRRSNARPRHFYTGFLF